MEFGFPNIQMIQRVLAGRVVPMSSAVVKKRDLLPNRSIGRSADSDSVGSRFET